MNDDNDFEMDANVSQAYKDLSTERAPDSLDAAVLEAAKPASGLGNLLALKPLSWAAVTLLSIGLVLELQRTDQLAPTEMQELAVPAVVDADDAKRETSHAEQAGVAVESSAAPLSIAPAVPSAEMIAEPIAEPMDRSLQKAREAVLETETLDRERIEPAAQLFEDRVDLPALRQQERFCDDTETVDASSWYRCVLDLREQGQLDAAALELSLLRTRFPDFEIR